MYPAGSSAVKPLHYSNLGFNWETTLCLDCEVLQACPLPPLEKPTDCGLPLFINGSQSGAVRWRHGDTGALIALHPYPIIAGISAGLGWTAGGFDVTIAYQSMWPSPMRRWSAAPAGMNIHLQPHIPISLVLLSENFFLFVKSIQVSFSGPTLDCTVITTHHKHLLACGVPRIRHVYARP